MIFSVFFSEELLPVSSHHKMTVSTVFFILIVTTLGSTSPVPREIYDIITDQHQMEVPQLGVSVPRVLWVTFRSSIQIKYIEDLCVSPSKRISGWGCFHLDQYLTF
jgi:hypothetical protein